MYSASDGEQEEVCEVFNEVRLELMRWEQSVLIWISTPKMPRLPVGKLSKCVQPSTQMGSIECIGSEIVYWS